MTTQQPPWLLTDLALAIPVEQAHPCIEIVTEDQLSEELETLAKASPRMVELQNDKHQVLLLGIGGPVGQVVWYPDRDDSRSVVAIAKRSSRLPSATFVNQGQPHAVQSKHLLPVEDTIEVALHIFRTGELPTWIEWES